MISLLIKALISNIWQSEFLQLIWQVAGLTYLWYIGSPQSKEEEEIKKCYNGLLKS